MQKTRIGKILEAMYNYKVMCSYAPHYAGIEKSGYFDFTSKYTDGYEESLRKLLDVANIEAKKQFGQYAKVIDIKRV
jgi:hypothetical protein